MKKTVLLTIVGLFLLTLTSFGVHKFYVSIYQINYAPEKKMLQITSRIFSDDLNDVLNKKYFKKTHLGQETETLEDVELMKKYLADNFSIKINGQQKPIVFLSKELEGNVIVCYYHIKEVSKPKTVEVQNTVLLDLNSNQQNIIQASVFGKKQNLLLTEKNYKGMLKP